MTLTFGQGHRHLDHKMRLIGLYLGTKYEVCRSNRFRDMDLGTLKTKIGIFDKEEMRM